MLQRTPLKENPGLQGLRFDALNQQPLFSATMPATPQKRATAVCLLSLSNHVEQIIADELGTNIAGALFAGTARAVLKEMGERVVVPQRPERVLRKVK